MNDAHLHLILNHVPVIGMAFATAAMVYATVAKEPGVRRLALLAVVVAGLTAIPAFLTGEPAEHQIKSMSGVEQERIEEHEEAADLAFWVAEVAAALALVTVSWPRLRRKESLPGLFLATLGAAVVVTALMGRAANLGGAIRHPEIRSDAAASTAKP